jgi:hypothetical protein
MAIQPYQMNGKDETVALSFFRLNKVATPVRITSFNSTGGKKQPTIQKNFLQTENVGKSPNTVPAMDVYVDNSYNLG